MSPAAYAIDPELAPALAEVAERTAGEPAAARGDWRALRKIAEANMRRLAELERDGIPDVELRDFETASSDGARLALCWYARTGSRPGSAAVFAHGGGMIAGDLNMYDPMLSRYAHVTGVRDPLVAGADRHRPRSRPSRRWRCRS